MKKKGFIFGAVIVALGGFLSKLIGAFYRIPLTNLLGGEGIGLYQLIFPVYCILLDFSSVGVPTALSKLIAERRARGEEEEGTHLLQASFRLLLLLGVTGSIALFCFSDLLANAQGNPLAAPSYRALAPAVFFVSAISCFRGYFQGKSRMFPTASSQVIEQVVKLGAGLLFVRLLLPDLSLAAAGAAAAVTVSECAAALYLGVLYLFSARGERKVAFDRARFPADVASVLSLSVPVALAGILLPLSQTADSFLIVNLMRAYTDRATALYGIYTGSVLSVVNLPVAICYGVAGAAVPYVSGGKGAESGKNARLALSLTALLSVPAALACLFGADFAMSVLFSRLPDTDRALAAGLLRAMSPAVVTLSLLQTTNSALVGAGRARVPVLTMGIGVLVKTALTLALLPLPAFGIYGAAIAANACYLVAVIFNLMYTLKKEKKAALPEAEPIPAGRKLPGGAEP